MTSDIIDIDIAAIHEPFRFELSLTRTNNLIGKEIPATTIKSILAALDVKIENENGEILSVAVPPYRVDVRREADLIEDILRIYGYNNVDVPQAVHSTLSYTRKPDREQVVNIASNLLTSNGFTEIMSNSLTKSAYYENLVSYPAESSVKILNPLSADLNVMRQTLLFNMLEAISLNVNHRNGNLKLYEFGNVYRYNAEKAEEGGLAPYYENQRLAMAITGLTAQQSWNSAAEPGSFFSLKAIAEKLLKRFGFSIYDMDKDPVSESDLFSEGVTMGLKGRKKPLFSLCIVAPKIRGIFDLKQEVYFLEMDFDLLLRSLPKKDITVSDLPKFPEVKRDLALLIDKSVTFAQLRSIAYATEKKLLRGVSLFDVYECDKLPEGKKSYALSFVLRDDAQTLTDQIIDRVMHNLITQFEQKAGATIR